jgi:CBS domain-containing protein
MAKQVRDIMTSNPITLETTHTAMDAARAMRDRDIGDVLVTSGGRIYGVLTDRDIVVRGVAQAGDPARIAVGDICSREVTTVSPSDTIDHAVTVMRELALRRLPVVQNGQPVGIVSLGDLALERDPESALGGISAAPPNR